MAFSKGHALVIAVATYPKIRHLPITVIKDGKDVYDLLINPVTCGYVSEHVKFLSDQKASRANILTELESLAQSTEENDTVIIYFSGHGGRIDTGSLKGNYLIPYDADPEKFRETTIQGEELTAILRRIKAGRLLILFDCCYSGGTAEPKSYLLPFPEFKSGLDEEYYNILRQGNGRAIIASSRSDEESLVLSGMENSLFTHYLLQALKGQAQNYNDGVIRILDLFHYVSEKVPAHDDRQHPVFKGEVENNFPISLYKGGSKSSVALEEKHQPSSAAPKYQVGRDNIAPESHVGQININNKSDIE